MTIDEINELWNKDCNIDEVDLKHATLDTPKLHAKYLGFLSEAKIRRLKLQKKRKQLQVTLKEYYSGELNNPQDLKELNREPFKLQVLNSQIQHYIEADTEMVEITLAKGYQDELISTLEDIMRMIHSRNFIISNIINYMKFMEGG
jgi:chemotaxis regulatin CheY-phosphate phosphatase CheZ